MKVKHVRNNNGANGRLTTKELARGSLEMFSTRSDDPDREEFTCRVKTQDPENDDVSHSFDAKYTPEECERVIAAMTRWLSEVKK